MKKVLIVDDNKMLLKILQTSLKKYESHFQAIFAHDGLEAMNILDAYAIDMVITDIQMPMVDGLVLLAFIRERYPDMPCIVITSHGDDDIMDLVDKEILHFINKPIHVKKLAKTIISDLKIEKKSAPQPSETHRMAIRDLLQEIMEKQQTCVFKLIPTEGAPGFCYFNKGKLFNAVYGKFKGREALQKILSCKKMDLFFSKPPKQEGKNNVNIDPIHLIQLSQTSNLSVEVKKTEK